MMQTDQLRKVAPLWLQYTEDVRADPDAWKLSGDAYATKPGDKPWISEMYGYSFACAKADVWHKVRMRPFVVGFPLGGACAHPALQSCMVVTAQLCPFDHQSLIPSFFLPHPTRRRRWE
jgi:hypothetical protein